MSRVAVLLLLLPVLVLTAGATSTHDDDDDAAAGDERALCFAAGRNVTHAAAWRACTLDREDSAFGSYVHWAAVGAGVDGTALRADTVAGSVRAGTLWVPPFAWVAYLAGRAECTSFVPSVDLAAGFVAASYLKLEELDADTGAVVATVDLGSAGWTDMELLPEGTTSIATSTASGSSEGPCGGGGGSAAHLRAARTRYKGRGAQCTLTVVVGGAAGVVRYGAVPVSPTTLAAVLDVRGHAYARAANRLRLVLAVAGAAGADCAGTVLAGATGRGRERVYSAAAPHAHVDGRRARADVSPLYEGASNNSVFDSALRSVFGAAFTLRLQHVVFPPGAQHIVYSPVLGYGDTVVFAEDAATHTAPHSILVLLLVVVSVVVSAIGSRF